MPAADGTTSPSALEQLAESAVQVGAVLVDGTVIVSVLLDQRIDDAGDVVDVMEIGYTIDGLPRTFYVHPGADFRWGEAAPAYISRRKAEIETIYALGTA
jgi:hypothetical protein